jgi:flagellar biosynthesis/type III secretory pathway protein FliH
VKDKAIEILESVLRRRYTIKRDAIMYAIEEALKQLKEIEPQPQPRGTLSVHVSDTIVTDDKVR